MLAYAALLALVVFGFMKLPVGFLPDEDQGTLFVLVQLPPGATNARTSDVLKQVEHHFLVDQKESVAGVFAVTGFSFAGSGQNVGFAFVKLRPWDERTGKGQSVTDVAAKAGAFFRYPRCQGVCVRTACGVGVGQCHRLRSDAAGPRQSGSRRVDAGA